MNLIKVSDKVLINPDMIQSVEQRGTGDNTRITVIVGNKSFNVTNTKMFFEELITHGVNMNDQFFRI